MFETIVTVSKEDLSNFARECLVSFPVSETATVIALSGNLGAGKTTFVKTIAAELGITEEVTSPTFTIMKSYESSDDTWKALIHMDAYRIDEISELGPLRFKELLRAPQTLFCIEWAEKINEVLPENTIWLDFQNTDDELVRIVRISGLPVNG